MGRGILVISSSSSTQRMGHILEQRIERNLQLRGREGEVGWVRRKLPLSGVGKQIRMARLDKAAGYLQCLQQTKVLKFVSTRCRSLPDAYIQIRCKSSGSAQALMLCTPRKLACLIVSTDSSQYLCWYLLHSAPPHR